MFFLAYFSCTEPTADGNFDPDHIVDIQLTIEEEDWNALCHQSRSFFSEFADDCMAAPFSGPYTYFPASITMDEQSLSNIGVRKKGFIGSQSTTKPSLRINLDEYEDGVELFQTDNITLNNAVQDPTRIRQCIAYSLFEKAGLPASRCNFARVSINGKEPTIYVHVEPIKRSFLRRTFGSDDGDLYEGTISDFDPIRQHTFEPKNSDTDESLTPILQLTNLFQSGEAIDRESLEEHLNLDAFLTFWSMEILTGHWDGYSGNNNNNFYIYRDPTSLQFHFIPWGLDDVFDPALHQEEERSTFSASALTNAILSEPELNPLFEEKLRLMLDTVWNEDEILAEVDRIEELLSAEPYMEPHLGEISSIRDYISVHREYIENSLPAEPTERPNPYCIQEVGEIQASFETTWGTNNNENPFEEGSADISIEMPNWRPNFLNSGAGAGFAEEESRGDSTLVLAGYSDDDVLLYPYLEFDHQRAAEGSLSIDQITTFGSVYYTTEELGYSPRHAGYLYGGSLDFEVFEATEGGTIRGSLSSPIYNWKEISSD